LPVSVFAKEDTPVIKSFIAGAITGAVVMVLYGREIAEYLQDRTFGFRMRAAEGLGAVAQGVGSVKNTVEAVKDRVEDGFTATRGA
jgi:hypothetical protein